jgi:hypothetical protein
MKKMNFLFIMAAAAIVINVTSCKKEDKLGSAISADNISALQDDAQVSDILDDVNNEADDVTNSLNANLKSAVLTGRDVAWTIISDSMRSATITYTNFQNPNAKNERVKNGVIHIVVTGKRSQNTYKRVVTFENFTINGNKIEGTKTITKVSDLVYQITIAGGKITFTDNTYITCNLTRTRTMVQGSDTPLNVWDDAYTFDGAASGVNRKGNAYVKTTSKPVKIYTAYRFPVEGTITLTSGNNVLELDYGTGALDDKATITVNGVSKEITLRK